MKQALISIVIPVYKVEPYLSKCIDSILAQTYTNLEIILVDDGSPDNCPKICDEYAKLDNRIIVIHKENGGLSDARNAGIRIVTGEYIGFVDSDDYIDAKMYEILAQKITKYEADISICSYIKIFEKSEKKLYKKLINQDILMTNIEALRALFTARDYGINSIRQSYLKVLKLPIQ